MKMNRCEIPVKRPKLNALQDASMWDACHLLGSKARGVLPPGMLTDIMHLCLVSLEPKERMLSLLLY